MLNDKIIVLPICGGGLKGTISIEFLYQLDQKFILKYKKSLLDIVDFYAGTSVGSIITAPLAFGVPVEIIHEIITKKGAKLFKRNWLPWKPKYTNKYILEELRRVITLYNDRVPEITDCKKKIMCITTDHVSDENVYLKSWKERWNKLSILDAIQYSFSACYYFGATNAPQYQMVFGDGGEGLDNCPLRETINSLKRTGVLGHNKVQHVCVISVGTGFVPSNRTYKSVSRWGKVREMLPYVKGLARKQSTKANVYNAQAEASSNPYFKFVHADIEIESKHDVLDGKKYIEQYKQYGRQMYAHNANAILDMLDN